MTKKRPTVIDVAKMAGVGASTVSRFLRGVSVRPEVGKRVANAVKRLGYEPDETARALRGGRSRTIGVILPQVANIFFSQAVQLIEEEARSRGSAVILLTHQESAERQATHLATLRRYRADGVILTAVPGTTLGDVRAVLPNVPIVAFDRWVSPEIDSVLLRNRDAARVATEHLLAHRYRSIACVTGKPEIYSFQERFAGYTEAMTKHKLRARLIAASDYDELRYGVSMILRGGNRPAALLSLSNVATLTILSAYDELSIAKEDRLPLIGFDDFAFAALVDPPLTVIRQPTANMIRYAMNFLFRRIDATSTEEAQAITLAGELICRRSCGCI